MAANVFPDRVRLAREAAGLTQEQAADDMGVDRTKISKVETGRQEPNLTQLAKMARCYSVSADWLLGLGDESWLPEAVASPEGGIVDIVGGLVRELLPETLERFGACTCAECAQEVMVATLNQLRPCYMRLEPGGSTAVLEARRRARRQEVSTELVRSVLRIKRQERHDGLKSDKEFPE